MQKTAWATPPSLSWRIVIHAHEDRPPETVEISPGDSNFNADYARDAVPVVEFQHSQLATGNPRVPVSRYTLLSGRPARSRLYCYPRPLLSPRDTSVSFTIAVFVGSACEANEGLEAIGSRPARCGTCPLPIRYPWIASATQLTEPEVNRRENDGMAVGCLLIPPVRLCPGCSCIDRPETPS